VDELTGLYNRRGLLVLAEKKIAEARRQQRPLFVLYLDIDDFKQVNDTYGHAEGDTVLRDVGVMLQSTFRASDIIARLGGDEFAVLGIDSEGVQSAGPGERLRRALDEHNHKSTTPYAISFSVGLRHFLADEITLDRALGDADAEMYVQKHERSAPPRQVS
jgi:diguanylate cyclase (GGDEF)-like protein